MKSQFYRLRCPNSNCPKHRKVLKNRIGKECCDYCRENLVPHSSETKENAAEYKRFHWERRRAIADEAAERENQSKQLARALRG